jgi:hypothetical protein
MNIGFAEIFVSKSDIFVFIYIIKLVGYAQKRYSDKKYEKTEKPYIHKKLYCDLYYEVEYRDNVSFPIYFLGRNAMYGK